jgi:hypothetical protein
MSADRSPSASFTLVVTSPPVLSALRINQPKFALSGRRVKGRCAPATRANRNNRQCNRPIALKVSYQLTVPARVTFTVQHIVDGQIVKGRCVAPTRSIQRARRCSRPVALPGAIMLTSTAGANGFTFDGRIGGQRLRDGSYKLIATPNANGRAGSSHSLAFQITS